MFTIVRSLHRRGIFGGEDTAAINRYNGLRERHFLSYSLGMR